VTWPGYEAIASTSTYEAQNTVNQVVVLTAGWEITLGTCGPGGSAFTGDTYLRLFGPGGTQVAANDDACGGLGSNLSYTSTAYVAHRIRAGCYSSGSCSGTVAWTIQ
jgi:hypothetical protein